MQQNIGFVKIQNGAFECLVRTENVNKVEAALAKVKPPKPGKSEVRQVDSKRFFPQYKPGMSTGEYVSRYNSLNNGLSFTHTHDVLAYDHPAAQYDPNVPLCVEDANPDYIPGLDDAPAKPKRTRKVKKAAPDKAAVMWLLMDHGLTMYQANPLADKLIALFEGA